MKAWFRALLEAIQAISGSLNSVRDSLLAWTMPRSDIEGDAEIRSRLDALEKSRALWEAEMEAVLVKADSTYKGAANAESRARTMLKKAKSLGFDDETDDGALDSEEELRQAYASLGLVPAADAGHSGPDGLQAVREGVEGEPAKARAMRAKFGG